MPLQETKQIVVFIDVLCACSRSPYQRHWARAEYETMLHFVIILAEKSNIFLSQKVFLAASLSFNWAVYAGNCSAEVKK